jgi:ABC-type lipoprotein release transport system permease subunit
MSFLEDLRRNPSLRVLATVLAPLWLGPFVLAKLLGWLLSWCFQIVIYNGWNRLTRTPLRLSPLGAILLAPAVLALTPVVLAIQLVIGVGLMLRAIGRWQCVPPGPDRDPISAERGADWAAVHVVVGLATVFGLALCVPMIPTILPFLHVPLRLYGAGALGTILLLLPAAGPWQRWRGRLRSGVLRTIAYWRLVCGVLLAAWILWLVAEHARLAARSMESSQGTAGLLLQVPWHLQHAEVVDWAFRVLAGAAVAAVVGYGLFYLIIYRGLLIRPLAPRVRQFMADRLFRRKRIAVFSVLAVTMAVAMELIGVGVTNGMLRAVEDASRRVLADVVMEGPMEGTAFYDAFIERARDVTVDVDGRPVRAAEAITPTITGWGVARFSVTGQPTYGVRIMGVRMDEYTQVLTRYGEGLMFRPYGPDAPPTFQIPEHWKPILEARGRRVSPGCIPGREVLPGTLEAARLKTYQRVTVKLTTIPVSSRSSPDPRPESRLVTVLDFHESKVFEFDKSHFYVPFQLAQGLFDMGEQWDVDQNLARPALCSRILFRIDPQVDLGRACEAIAARWKAFLGGIYEGIIADLQKDFFKPLRRRPSSEPMPASAYSALLRRLFSVPAAATEQEARDQIQRRWTAFLTVLRDVARVFPDLDIRQVERVPESPEAFEAFLRRLFQVAPDAEEKAARQQITQRWQAIREVVFEWLQRNTHVEVETWRQRQRKIISAFEQQKVLFIVVFAVISVVAGFLILAIFIMIVTEKTRDIGILKSLGASDGDVLRTFLSFALVIGVVGALIGWGLATVFLQNINAIRDWVGDILGIKIFPEDVFIFADLPTSLEPLDTAMILVGSVVISVLAAYVPARRAAKLPPVEAVSYE